MRTRRTRRKLSTMSSSTLWCSVSHPLIMDIIIIIMVGVSLLYILTLCYIIFMIHSQLTVLHISTSGGRRAEVVCTEGDNLIEMEKY